MDIDELQTVQSRERQTDSLQQLRDSFYGEASDFIQQLRDARDDAAQRAEDPWDNPEVNRLSDEIKTAEQTVEAIYDRRVGKIVKKASLAAAEMPTDEDGLTSEEQALFERLVESIQDNRDHVLDMVAGDVAPDTSPVDGDAASRESEPTAPTDDQRASLVETEPSPPPEPEPASSAESTDAGEDGVSAADVMNPDGATKQADGGQKSVPGEAPSPPPEGSSPDGAQHSEASDSVSRRTVKITKDVGEILGVDQREYDLSTDDVVTLPADNAEPLVQRDAAQPLD